MEPNLRMVVTIDGPAGAGKSTASRALAKRLGFEFLDTGAMYRTVALAGLQRQIDWNDQRAVAEMLESLQIDLRGKSVCLNGEDVSAAIRASEVTTRVHLAADQPLVREHLVQLQRRVANNRRMVTEGRDQGTVVFPDAVCKIFLTAPAKERAQRRFDELQRSGESVSFEEVLEQQRDRDERDTRREVGRLVAADDAIPVRTDGLSPDQVVDRLEQLVRDRIEKATTAAG